MHAKMIYAGVSGVLLLSQTWLPGAQAAPQSSSNMQPQSIFVSGHSLTNEPIPSDLSAIAAGFGLKLAWNRQYLEGSSIKQRSVGAGAAQRVDYRQGVDRANRPVDVLAELRSPTTHPGKSYDVLVITEQNNLLGSLVWNDTLRYLRDFQDRFIDTNPVGISYFYEPWISLDDKSDPKNWIAYERSAAPVWRCTVERVNQAIAATGRRDRIVTLPAALALAQLIERSTQGSGLPGVSRTTVRATIDSLVADDVHLTRLGNYYMALVSFAYIFDRSPLGAWRPDGVSEQEAVALQGVAGEFARQPQPSAMSYAACGDYVRKSFMWRYLGYLDSAYLRKEKGFWGSLLWRYKIAAQWLWLFSFESADNPFSNTR